jgi:putative ABC transport system permease protein
MTGPLWKRVFRLQRQNPREDVEEEFSFHLEERIERLMAEGMPEAAARELALRRFGDIAAATETCSDIGLRRARRARWSESMRSISRDVAYAIKAMRRSPGFAFATLATIALGIGANTVVFSLLNAVLLQPLDAERPRELVRVYTSQGHAQRDERDRFGGSSYADYLNLRHARALAGLAAYMPVSASVQVNSASSRAEARVVSENFFALLGRPPLLGSWRIGEDAREVIISHRFWSTALGGDSSVIGDPLVVNGITVRIAGITSPRFEGIEPSNVDLYFPFASAASWLTARAELLTGRSERSVRLIGRLAAGATPVSVEQELNGIMGALAAEFPASNAGRTVAVREASSIVPLELTGQGIIPTAVLVFGATLVMLAISGVNVAGLLMARTISRRRELAVRLSLGATPVRLIRQLVTESAVLALGAGIVVIALVSLLPVIATAIGVPRPVQPTVDSTVLTYAVVVAIGFGVLFGLGPAIVGMRADVLESLRGGSASTRPARARAQRTLVCSQIALSMALLLVSGALLESLERQRRVDPGFTVNSLIVADFEDPLGATTVERERAFVQLAVQRLGALEGVVSVSVGSDAPLTSDGVRSTTHIPGYTPRPDENMDIQVVETGPDFFRTLGIPMLRGRELTWEQSDTLPYVVINRSMARRYWGERDPIGTRIELGGKGGRPAEVIGVASDARFLSLAEAPRAMYAVQRARGISHTVIIRTRGDPSALLLAVRGSMSGNDVPFALAGLRTMEDVLQMSLIVSRAVSQTVAVMGMLAILLAAVGLYGVVAYVMAGRTREFGVRLALGATPSGIMRLVVNYGLRLAAIGGIAGLALGLGALRLIQSLLFGSWTSASLGIVFGAVLCGVTLVACALPAVRATRTSPASALRVE